MNYENKVLVQTLFTKRMNLEIIHLRRQHVLGGDSLVPMVERSHYIMFKNPLHKHFAGMPMVGG